MAEIVKKAVLDIDGKASITTIRELQKELKRAKDNMVGLEEGSDAFLEAANKAGELKHQLDAINQATRASSKDFGDLMANTAKVGAGMVGAFQSVKGAMTLLGVESENVGKAIEKMQASMAVIQGLQSIDGGIKSFKTLTTAIGGATQGMNKFKVALVATGLGALVVVLGSIIANWDEFTESIGLSSEELLKLQDVWNGVMGVLQGSLKGLTRAIMKITTGDFKGAWEAVKEGFNITENYTNGVAKGIEKRTKEASENIVSTVKSTVAEVNEEIGKVWGVKDEEAQMKFNYIFNEQQLREQLDQGLIDIETFNQRKLELDTAYYEDYQTLQQSIFENESLSYSERLTAYQNFLKSKEEQTKNAADNMAASNTNAADDAEGDWSKSFNSITNVTTQAFSSMSSIVSAFADSQDKNTKEGFEANKKAQIALATFSMLSGILQAIQGGNAMAAQLGLAAPAGWAMGAAMAAATAATGAINIAKIAQTKFGDNASGGSSAPSTSQAAIQSIQAPVQYTQDIQGTSIEEAIKDTRVYVVESDITDTQNKVDVAESESRF